MLLPNTRVQFCAIFVSLLDESRSHWYNKLCKTPLFLYVLHCFLSLFEYVIRMEDF